jgi:dynactin complex subunit
MKIRLHEIELGSASKSDSADLFQLLLGLKPKLAQDGLTVFDAGAEGLDFNVSNHVPAGVVAISFLTDDLAEVEKRLKEAAVAYEGPLASHLGMTTIRFRHPDGYIIQVNSRGNESPLWLQV